MLPKTYIPKETDIDRKWLLIDAKDQILGRLATRIASLLIGKGKAIYTPHMECGDHIVVVNAKQIRVTGAKLKNKIYSHYTGYPGGLHQYSFETLLAKKPEEIIIRAVERMLPKNRLASRMMKRLHVYADGTHEQQAQKPAALQL
ncbi:MAG: 50S ribosomal protein L13 [Candidatus Omnitrophica bacterium]|nr:50S ribosomal protein L13 [Candidatus Omnitrophota bacterium]